MKDLSLYSVTNIVSVIMEAINLLFLSQHLKFIIKIGKISLRGW